ncbi:ORF20 [Fusarium agapanthi]|uniref:ORF20 n=1 Tax=Fusarium agapanthi TaxID=1803897 RepID=A0A9P5E771_9HYPO|nr:ORF20 [Fusarium agapanthi]
MIGRILLHIREACDEAKETHLPTEILVILYGFGNPAIGCHMDCTKCFVDPDEIITPTMILNELPPDRDVTLAMRMFTTHPWAHVYTLQGTQLDRVKRVYRDAYRQAGADGTLIKQCFTEEDVLDYRHSKGPELLNKWYRSNRGQNITIHEGVSTGAMAAGNEKGSLAGNGGALSAVNGVLDG